MLPEPHDERLRHRALLDLDVLDSPPEPEFDALVQAAALACGVPISLISLVDRDRQWFKANVGLPGASETPREYAFCAHAILQSDIFQVRDAQNDSRFSDNPLVTGDPNIRFYAGAPLCLADGHRVGTLCVIDRAPHELDGAQRSILGHLATAAAAALERRRDSRSRTESDTKYRVLTDSAPDAIISIDAEQRIVLFNAAAEAMFRCRANEVIGEPISRFIPQAARAKHADHVRAFGGASDSARLMHGRGRLFGLRADGSQFPLEASISHTQVRGTPMFTAILRDISEIEQFHSQMAARTVELSIANHALAVASQQLRDAQRITHVGSWEFDLKTGNVTWSEELFRIMDRPLDAGVVPFLDQARIYAKESWRRLTDAVERCRTSGASYELELELTLPSAARRWAIGRGEARYASDGTVDRLVGTLQDITELKVARAEQQRASERSRLAIRAARMGVWELDLFDGAVIWDGAMFQLWGVEEGGFSGTVEAWLDLMHLDDRRDASTAFANAANGGSDIELSVRTWNANAESRHLRTMASVHRNADDEHVRLIGVCWDISEQLRAELALRNNALLLYEFVEHAPAAIAMFDREMRYLQASERWAQTYNTGLERLIGFQHYALFPETSEHWKAIHRRVLAGETLTGEADPIQQNSVDRWFEWEARPWHEPDGRIGGLTWFMRDVSDKLRMQQLLLDQKQMLERNTAQLRDTVAFKRALLDASGMSIIAADTQGCITKFNRTAEILLGWSQAEMLGRTPAVFHDPDEVAKRAQELTQETGRLVEPGFQVFVTNVRHDKWEQRSWTYIRKDGTRLPVLLSVSALHSDDGTIIGYVGVAADMTEERRAQAQLAQMSRRLQVATTGGGVGIWEWDIVRSTLSWDDRMLAIYGGLPRERFHDRYEDWRDLVHPEDLPLVERALDGALAGTSTYDLTFRARLGDGTIRHIRAHGVVERDPSGRPLRMLGTNWDVTKERETEESLLRTSSLLREFVGHAPASIAMFDRNMRYLFVSQRWLNDYRLTGQELVGRSHYEVFPQLPAHWHAVHDRVLAGAVEQSDEDVYTLANGDEEWLQWEARPWRGGDGHVAGLILFTQVITARKALELRLRTQGEELRRSNEELQQFAYVASHDLQEPLRAVAGCAQLLAATNKGRLDASADELITHIVDGAHRMQTLIQDLLSLSRMTSHAEELEPVDCDVVCSAALANLSAAVQDSAAEIEVQPLPTIVGVRLQLIQLFQNLIGNAIKYSGGRRPKVQIRSVAAESEHVFSISDNGIGIERQYFERIFGVFQRLHTREQYTGTGIGLAICSKVVQRHGGRIWVESVPGSGSTFYFALPRAHTGKP